MNEIYDSVYASDYEYIEHATNLSIFSEVSEHDNDPTLPLIHHLPEVTTGRLHWSLGNDEPFTLLVALGGGGGGGGVNLE